MSYIALYCYLSFNKTHVTIGVACLSVLYLGTLLFRLMLKKPPGGETHNRRATVTSHFGITRPQTNDTRLNIGPQLVFPIPEEYSTPGARHQNERKTSSD
ncbi:unnamed protein product [Orchesella dallaii]|uniref:Uncharacterized protein n=1 Tax=Orchesella dallaii TaxID=48710 RepID=A0ABP1QQP6_9HEXA